MAKTASTSAASAPRTTAKKRIRKIFGDIHEVVKMPNLIEVQRESYEQFLRSDPSVGYVSGLEKTLRSVFPIENGRSLMPCLPVRFTARTGRGHRRYARDTLYPALRAQAARCD